MQDFYLVINWSAAIAMLGLGFVALLKNFSLALNRYFALFTVTIGIWIVASYTSNDPVNSPRASVLGNYLVFLFSYLSGYLLAWFAIKLADDKKAARRLRVLSPIILPLSLINCTPLVVAGAVRQGSVYAVKFGPLVAVYSLVLVALLTTALVVLHKNIKITSGDQRSHLVLLYRSMGIALPILLLTEFIIPALTGWFGLTNIGIVVMVLPVVALYYGVVKLKLFNLKLVIVRSIAYGVTLGLLSSFYGLATYSGTSAITKLHDRLLNVLLNVALIIIVAISYAPLQRLFNKWTNRIFFRDAYDPQLFIGQLNKVLVATIDLDTLMLNVSRVIATNIKAEYCALGVGSAHFHRQRIVGTTQRVFDPDEINQIRDGVEKQREQVIITELLPPEQTALQQKLVKNEIAALVRIIPKEAKGSSDLGFIILGEKKSGNAYAGQDSSILEIIAHELLIAIQNALRFEEIQNFNLTLQDKVNIATRKLRHANERLKALDETKDDFISMASHQLRTPLTSIKGYLSMVLEGDAGKITKMERDMLGQAFFSSQRMVYLIADLLNVSRLKTGKFIIESSSVNLATMVEQEIGQLKETAASRNLTLNYERPKDFPDMQLDETKTRQVVMNFVDNAIYYTPAGGYITVRLINNPTTVELRVEDNGIGVAKSDQPHLFTKFYRAGNARKARPDGTGLGLFMAKKVIIAEGGSIIFESEQGKGSTFGFVFSKSKVASQGSGL